MEIWGRKVAGTRDWVYSYFNDSLKLVTQKERTQICCRLLLLKVAKYDFVSALCCTARCPNFSENNRHFGKLLSIKIYTAAQVFIRPQKTYASFSISKGALVNHLKLRPWNGVHGLLVVIRN